MFLPIFDLFLVSLCPKDLSSEKLTFIIYTTIQ